MGVLECPRGHEGILEVNELPRRVLHCHRKRKTCHGSYDHGGHNLKHHGGPCGVVDCHETL